MKEIVKPTLELSANDKEEEKEKGKDISNNKEDDSNWFKLKID